MAYTVLNESLQVKGKLTLNNGQGSTAFFADTITQQLATDNSSDPTNSTAMAFNEYDKQGNAKQWGHSITVSVEATDLGSGISTNDYLMYFDDVNNHYYLMKVITAETDRNSGFVTISGINTAIYELGKQIVNAETTFKQANLQAVVNSLYKNAPFSVVIQDDLATVIDYTVSANTSLQAVLQDLQTKYNVDVDSWIELDESGNISDRIIYFGHIGQDNGELIRYGGAKGFENINAQELSDTIYTKLYVTGLTNDTDPTKGHIGSVNNGMEYIVDDNANGLQYAIGASQQQPVYLEGSITNTLLSEPQALLTWANAQMSIFNHPRFNYTVTPLHDQIVGIGDTIAVQDFHVKPEILVTSKVIQKSTSFASPETNTFVLGEFSSIFTENANKGAGVIQLIKKDITVVQEAADNARVAADEAHKQAVIAQEQAIHAQTSADGKTTTYTVDSFQDLPDNAVEGDLGWVKLSDGTHMYSYTDGKWVEKINPSMGADINKKVLDAVTQAKEHVEEVKQGLVNDIATAKSQATSQANSALASAKSEATSLFNQAQNALSDAKTDLTNSIASEASARNQAVAAANSQAQNYVNQAKSDITDTINAISVGSRNLLLTSSTMSNTSAWVSPSTKDGETYQGMIMSANTAAWSGPKYRISDLYNRSVINENDTYTYSAFVRNTSDTDIQIRFYGASNTTTNFTDPTGIAIATMTAHTDWTRLSVTFKFKNLSQIDAATIRFEPIYNVTNGYVNQSGFKLEKGIIPTDWTPAPEDVVLDYTTKDNKIKETITQYQYTNDGLVSKAQTAATTALGLVETKVSLTVYNQKTGELSSNINDVKDTADSSAQTIADIQEADGKQDARISEVEKTAGEIKSTVSDISTTQGKQSGSISALQQRANGFDATVTKVDNLAVGGRNLLLGTRDWTDNTRWNQENTVTKDVYKGIFIASSGSAWASPAYMMQNAGILQVGKTYTFSTYVRNTSDTDTNVASYYDNEIVAFGAYTIPLPAHTDWVRVSKTFKVIKDPTTSTSGLRWEGQSALTNGQIQFAGYKLEEGNLPTDWTPAPEDVDSATAKAQLTADNASAAVTKLTNADGVITKAQADIQANADAISQKVSKTVYDQNTGDLTQAISKAQSTADGAVSTVGSYKTSNDGRVKAAESKIEQNSKDITARVSQTDYNNNNSQLNTRFTKVEATADGASTTVGKLQTAVNNLGQVNQLFNTEFTPDLQGWTVSGTKPPYKSYVPVGIGSTSIGFWTIDAEETTYHRLWQTLPIPSISGGKISLSWRADVVQKTNYNHLFVKFYDKDGKGVFNNVNNQEVMVDWDNTGSANSVVKLEGIVVPDEASTVTVDFEVREGTRAYLSQPMLVFSDTIGTYVPGNYNNNAALAQVKITADSISNFVRDSSGNISSNFQTALSKTSIITGSTLASSIKTQTSSQISSALTDNNGKIISLINQDSSGVQIAGKNIVLDGKVRITNEFTVGQANIANGAIGTAQIGDASITSAKIANLDVSKLTGDTITGFNFNVNRSMNIASGGVIKSDVINMDKTSFILNTSTVATDTVTTAANNKMILSNVTYSIDSTKGAIISSGKVNLSHTNGSTSNANFDFRIAPDYFSMSSKNWSDGSNDNYMTMTDYSVSFLAGSPLIDKASSYSYVGQDGIATTGTVLADAISGHGSKPMYINAGGTLRLAANDGSGVKVYISNTNVQTDSPIISGNITLNTGHAIISNDNGKMFFYGSNGNQIDLGVKSLSQSSLVSLKENISKVIPKQLLSETLRADLRSYNFTGDDITDKHVTPMIDDVNHEMYIPNDWLSPESTGVDTYSVIGYLIGSVKALQEQITELKANQ